MQCKIGEFVVDIKARYEFHDKPNRRDTLFFLEQIKQGFDDAAILEHRRRRECFAKAYYNIVKDCEQALRDGGFYNLEDKLEGDA